MAILNPTGLPHAGRTIMIYSVSGEGKTGQIGELAKDEFERTGKKSLLVTMDHGGYETVRHLAEGDDAILDVLLMLGRDLPWEWVQFVSEGRIPSGLNGEWSLLDPRVYGLVGFDGASGLADILLKDLAIKAGAGKNVTGQSPSIKFKEGSASVTNNAPAHFGLVQARIMQAMQDSFRIPVNTVVWSALARSAEEESSSSGVVGPQIAGKAVTAAVPAQFMYTFRISAVPSNPALGIVGTTRLYLYPHTDGVAAGSKGLTNARVPVGIKVPDFIEPASVVEGMKVIEQARAEAKEQWEHKKAQLRAMMEKA